MICVIRGKNLTERERRFLSDEFKNYFISYDLDYVFMCEDKQ